MTNPTAADLLAMLKRAEHREREAVREAGANALGDLIKADHERHLRQTFAGANSAQARDRLRSEAEALTLNDLELRRALGDTLSPEEEAQRADLVARRSVSGYIAPAAEEAGE